MAVKQKPKKSKASDNKDTAIQDRMAAVFSDHLDDVSKKFQLVTGLHKQPRISSGSLVADVILGGGVVPGMLTWLGPEASAKSTMSMTLLGSSIQAKVPINLYFDAENAVDPSYTSGILKVKSLDQVFGLQDPKTGKWVVPPKARYSDANVIEDIFKPIHTILRGLPSKRYRPDREEWFLIFGREQAERKKMAELELKHDAKLYSETGMYWCPIGDDARPQAMFFIDSYPALVTEAVDEQEDEGNALALEARSFSKFVKRVTGQLRKKAAILDGVNQLRDAPMVRYGPKYTEPGGNALKFFSTSRNMLRHVVPPSGWDRDSDNGGTCIEESVQGDGFDYYHFKSIRNLKNKHGIPHRKGLCRVWVEDCNGKARGIDPVFDAWSFYSMLGMIEGGRREKKGFQITGIKKIAGTRMPWHAFKSLILAEALNNGKLLEEAVKGGAPRFKLLEHARKLVESGEAESKYVSAKQAGTSGEVEDLDV